MVARPATHKPYKTTANPNRVRAELGFTTVLLYVMDDPHGRHQKRRPGI
jgi:hypothetical protein